MHLNPELEPWNGHQDQRKNRCQIGDEADCDSLSGNSGMLFPQRNEELFSHEKILRPRRQRRRWCRLFEVPAPQAANSIQQLQNRKRTRTIKIASARSFPKFVKGGR
jgi:hypothetical protein